MDSLYKLAYDETIRALAEQQQVIESFRDRTGILFSAAAITTSFLGAQALQGDQVSLFSWLALASFAGVAASSLAVLWPRRWEIATNSGDLIAACSGDADPMSIEDLHRELSLQMHGSYLANHEDCAKLVVFFQVASVLLAIEVLLWIVAIAITS